MLSTTQLARKCNARAIVSALKLSLEPPQNGRLSRQACLFTTSASIRSDPPGSKPKLILEDEIRKIVTPSKYDEIRSVQAVTSDALLSDKDIGSQLAAMSKDKLRTMQQNLDKLLFMNDGKKIEFTPEEYDLFLDGYNAARSPWRCLRVFQFMKQQGIAPTLAQFNTELKTAADESNSEAIYDIGEEMRISGIEDEGSNFVSYFNQLLISLGRRGQIELAYLVYLEMKQRNIIPQRAGYHTLIVGLAKAGEVSIAYDTLLEAQNQAHSFDVSVYQILLHYAGLYMEHAPYSFCFTQLSTVFNVSLTEGNYLMGLTIATREKDIKLGSLILKELQNKSYNLGEQHFEPFFEAFVGKKKWKAAFKVLNMMREASLGLKPNTLYFLSDTLSTLSENDDVVASTDEIFEIIAQGSKEMPYVLDTVTLNALISALARSGHVEAASNRIEQWYDSLGIKRDINTYVYILQGCEKEKNKAIAELLLTKYIDQDMFEPTKEIYELMVGISLNQYNYEDAFVYLDAMKAHNIVPSSAIYSKIARRCARVRDPRAQFALDEMQASGYSVSPGLKKFVATDGTGDLQSQSGAGAQRGRREPPKKEKNDDIADLNSILSSDLFKI